MSDGSKTSDAYCVPLARIEEALIKMLLKEHPGALTISIDWDVKVEKCAAILWWSPSPSRVASCGHQWHEETVSGKVVLVCYFCGSEHDKVGGEVRREIATGRQKAK